MGEREEDYVYWGVLAICFLLHFFKYFWKWADYLKNMFHYLISFGLPGSFKIMTTKNKVNFHDWPSTEKHEFCSSGSLRLLCLYHRTRKDNSELSSWQLTLVEREKPRQCFPNFNVHQNHLECLSKHKFLSLVHKDSDSIDLEWPKYLAI